MKRDTTSVAGRRRMAMLALVEAIDLGEPGATTEQIVHDAVQFGGSWDLTEAEVRAVLSMHVRDALHLPIQR